MHCPKVSFSDVIHRSEKRLDCLKTLQILSELLKQILNFDLVPRFLKYYFKAALTRLYVACRQQYDELGRFMAAYANEFNEKCMHFLLKVLILSILTQYSNCNSGKNTTPLLLAPLHHFFISFYTSNAMQRIDAAKISRILAKAKSYALNKLLISNYTKYSGVATLLATIRQCCFYLQLHNDLVFVKFGAVMVYFCSFFVFVLKSDK